MKKISKYIGLVLFLASFGLFTFLWSIESHRLDQAKLRETLPSEKAELFLKYSEDLLKTDFDLNTALITKLKESFQEANDEVLNTYGLSEEELEKMIAVQSEDKFSLEQAISVFDSSSQQGKFKMKAIEDYGSWLDGQTVDDKLQKNLDEVVSNIKRYEVVKQFGFDQYAEKQYVYELTKISSFGPVSSHPVLFLILCFGGMILGGLAYILPDYRDDPPGIRNNGIFHKAISSRGWIGLLLGIWLIAFYIVLYFYHEYMTAWIIMTDPVSYWLKGSAGGQFFLYGLMYTLVIIVMGVRMLIKYRFSKYQSFRTLSVMFFQTAFAFLIPEILLRLNQPYYDFKNIWPLDYDFFFNSELNNLIESGTLGIFMLVWGIALIIIGVPVFVYFFGKRWYCSWVCGCGGLAETMGDPFRQLSDKRLKAWQIERYMVHGVLVFAVIMTAGVLYTYFSGSSQILGLSTYKVREVYGAWIGAGFAGVVGTGFYPFMGNRVWCRFGCPLAAYLGIVQRFKSRFRITTNGGQCISCGNCSTYCEMGIDVRWYAQRGQNIVRSSCVGCGICSQVCPRGVLKLENGPEKGRFGTADLPGLKSV